MHLFKLVPVISDVATSNFMTMFEELLRIIYLFQGPGGIDGHQTVKKIFIGGLKDPIDEQDIKDYFSQYGNVQCVDLPVVKDSGKKRGFAFCLFDNYDPVDKICGMYSLSVCVCTYIICQADQRVINHSFIVLFLYLYGCLFD